MLRALIVAAAVLAAAGAAGARTTGGTPVAFVALPERSQLVAVDLSGRRELGRIAVPREPRSVTSFHDGRRGRPFVLVASASTVGLVDAVARRVVHVWRDFGRPYDVEVEGVFAYVTDEARGELVRIDLRSRNIVERLDAGPSPRALAVSDAALVNNAGAGRVTLVETWRSRMRLVGSLELGEPIHDLAEQADSGWAYATLPRSGRVARFDWGRGHVDWRRRVGSRADPLAFDHYDGRRLWTANAKQLVRLSSTDGRVLRRLEGCPNASGIALGGTAWVTATCSNKRLAVWHTSRWQPTLYWLGSRPDGVTVAVLP